VRTGIESSFTSAAAEQETVGAGADRAPAATSPDQRESINGGRSEGHVNAEPFWRCIWPHIIEMSEHMCSHELSDVAVVHVIWFALVRAAGIRVDQSSERASRVTQRAIKAWCELQLTGPNAYRKMRMQNIYIYIDLECRIDSSFVQATVLINPL
jgi:hypothetical protein